MDTIHRIAWKHGLTVIEDAAQAIQAFYGGKPLGSLGHMAAFSFHATKNVVSGEGGALVINDPTLVDRAEIIWEKGTNRSQFFRGEVDKYTWVDIGSSYLPSELVAAFLWAQLEQSEEITTNRMTIWRRYHRAFAELEMQRKVYRPAVPRTCQHNAHIYYLLVNDLETRTAIIQQLKQFNVQATFHYVPLHNSPAGSRFGRVAGQLAVTEDICDRIVRLPLSASLSLEEAELVISLVLDALNG